MRRFYGLLVLLLASLPFSAGVAGCKHAMAPDYCPGFSDSGPVGGQATNIAFGGNLTNVGESLNFGQIGSSLSASATDCFGAAVSVTAYTFGTSNMQIADINPATGQVCAGTWNRNTGGGVADYSVCTPPAKVPSSSVAYVTASAAGVTSNPIPIYVHPAIGSIAIGAASTNCTTDPSSNCCPANTTTITAAVYDQMSCVSQASIVTNGVNQNTRQLVARAFDTSGNNITCQVGHITFSPQTSSSVVTIDANGLATAVQPGSTTILASVSNSSSGSTAGFFSTCPPKSIVLSAPGATAAANGITVAQNNAQALSTTILDTQGNVITGVPLEFVSTSPQTLAVGSNTVTPSFPGAGTITAICQPSSCNPSAYSQIGYLGNGKPISSNGLTVTTSGTSGNQVIVASTQSLFFYSVDFTTASPGATYKLPYMPNSMVSTVDGSTVYLGSTNVLMAISTASLAVTSVGAIPGQVLAVSPDGATLVIVDSTRSVTSLYSSAGALETTYNGVGQRAQWSPDSSTVYIAAGTQLLVHSTFTGWTSTPVSANPQSPAGVSYQDVAVNVPAYGAYLAGGTDTEGRSYCATSLNTTPSSPPPVVNNTFYPVAQTDILAPLQRVAATSDGMHVLGEGLSVVSGASVPTLYDLAIAPPTSSTDPRLACTTNTASVTFATTDTTKQLPIPSGSTFTGVVPAANASIAFVNYSLPSTAGASTKALPFYFPATGTLNSLPLTGTATAPVAGVFSSDSTTFYTTTQNDNALHIISINGTTVTDSSTILVNLQNNSGVTVTPDLIVSRVKRATS